MENLTRVQKCSYGKCVVANTKLDRGTIVQKYKGNIVIWVIWRYLWILVTGDR